MMANEDFILKGTPLGPVPNCSLGEYLYKKVRSHSPELIIQVDADTGAEQTINELITMSIRLSEGLKKRGLNENDVVGLLCKNCFEASEIVLGTWFSGAAISPAFGKMTIAEMKNFLELSRPKFLFCDKDAIENAAKAVKLVSVSCSVIFVGNDKKLQQQHTTFQDVLVEADVKNYKPQPVSSPSTQAAAIPWSSGTTGLPKAVIVTHKSLIFQEIIMGQFFPLNKRMVILQISHFFWITGVFMFLNSLTTGSKRVLMRDSTVDNCLNAMQKYKTEWSLMAPLFAFSIVNHPDFDKYDLSSMKYITLGGSPLIENIAKRIMEKWKTIKIFQAYGTTEFSGTICTSNENGNLYSVGKVTPETQLKVVDENGKALEAKKLGEILVKSPGITIGYLRNEEATKELLDSEGWLRTGDMGYYDELGQVYLVDRLKEMIKIMNMQIAPAEIENEILNVTGVKEVGVAGVTKSDNSCELMAFVVKEENSNVTEKDIKAHTASALSDYKQITGGIYFVDHLPKTASEKLQRKELRRMAQELYSKSCK